MKSGRDAQLTSFGAMLLCPLVSLPAIILGVIARNTG